MTLQAAIFDCDGLLADTETPDFHAWSLIYAEHGLTLNLADWAATIGIAKGHDIADRHTAPLPGHYGPITRPLPGQALKTTVPTTVTTYSPLRPH